MAMNPPRADLFPWWTSYMLDAMTAAMCAMLVWIVGAYAKDFWQIVNDLWHDLRR